MNNASYLIKLLRSSYIESNNLKIKYNSVVCASCEFILKADFRFIIDHCEMESHKRKTISGGHNCSGPQNKKLSIKPIQDGNAIRRYDITVSHSTAGLPTDERGDNPYLKTSNTSSVGQMETKGRFDDKELFPVKKEHNQLFAGKGNLKSLLDSYKGGTANAKKENKPTILLAKCGSPRKSNTSDVLCERSILNYEDIEYEYIEDKLVQNVRNDSKYQKSFKSTKPIKNDTRTEESETFILLQNNVSIRQDNLYFCETCNVRLESGNEHLYKHIKTKTHCRFLADNMYQYFSMPKKYSQKQLFFHGLYELRCDLFYCKRCDLVLDATDRSILTKHSLSVDHNYALCQHLEKLYDDNKLSMKLEHNIGSEKCKELHCDLEPKTEAFEDHDILGENVAAPKNENFVKTNIAVSKNGNIAFNQNTIKDTQSQRYMNKSRPELGIPTSSKTKINDRGVNIVSSKNADLNLHSDLTDKLVENIGMQPQNTMSCPVEISIPTSSKPKLNDKGGKRVISHNSDTRTDHAEKLLKNLVIGSPEPAKNDQHLANDVAVKKFLGIKGIQAVKEQLIVENGVFDDNQTDFGFMLPELEPIILDKSSVTLTDDERFLCKCLLVSEQQNLTLKKFIDGC